MTKKKPAARKKRTTKSDRLRAAIRKNSFTLSRLIEDLTKLKKAGAEIISISGCTTVDSVVIPTDSGFEDRFPIGPGRLELTATIRVPRKLVRE